MLYCIECQRSYPSDPVLHTCAACGAPLEVRLTPEELARAGTFEGRGVWRYQALLPVERGVTLGEGGTGLDSCGMSGSRPGLVPECGSGRS